MIYIYITHVDTQDQIIEKAIKEDVGCGEFLSTLFA